MSFEVQCNVGNFGSVGTVAEVYSMSFVSMACILWPWLLCNNCCAAVGRFVSAPAAETHAVLYDYTEWYRQLAICLPSFYVKFEAEKLISPGFISSFSDLEFSERKAALEDLISRSATGHEADEWSQAIDIAIPWSLRQVSRTSAALTNPGLRTLAPEPETSVVGVEEILRSFKHRKGDSGWLPRVANKKAFVPAALVRDQWVRAASEFLFSTQLPFVLQLQSSNDPDALALRLCGGLRGSTLKRKVRVAQKFQEWLSATYDLLWPTRATQLLDYFIELSQEPCAPSTPGAVISAISFFEKMGGVPHHEMLSQDFTIASVIKDIVVDLKTKAGVKARKKAAPMLISMIIALEALVITLSVPLFFRIYAWWRLVRVWAALRWSDCLHMPPHLARMSPLGLALTIVQSKTTGLGRRWN